MSNHEFERKLHNSHHYQSVQIPWFKRQTRPDDVTWYAESRRRRFRIRQRCPNGKLRSVRIAMMNPDHIKDRSVVHVRTPTVKDKNGIAEGGPQDPCMGTTDRSVQCRTCFNSIVDDQGHEGHIEFVEPMQDPEHMNYTFLALSAVCRNCSRIRLRKNHPKYAQFLKLPPKSRLRFAAEYAPMVCPAPKLDADGNYIFDEESGCGCAQVKYVKGKTTILFQIPEGVQESSIPFPNPEDWSNKNVHTILSAIPNEDLQLLGISPEFSHPAWSLYTNMPVPPMAIRPSLSQDEDVGRGHDDLTLRIRTMIAQNNRAKQILQWIQCIESTPTGPQSVGLFLPHNRPVASTEKKEKKVTKSSNVELEPGMRFHLCACDCVENANLYSGPAKVKIMACGCRCMDQLRHLSFPKRCGCKFRQDGDVAASHPGAQQPTHHPHLTSSQAAITIGEVHLLSPSPVLDRLKQRTLSRLKEIYRVTIQKLQETVTTYITNPFKKLKVVHRNGKLMGSLTARHKGKRARIRGTLMGKRNNNNARGVTDGDPFLPIDTLGVPFHVAKTNSFPMEVTHLNMAFAYELIRNGPYNYPGASKIKTLDGNIRDLTVMDEDRFSVVLEVGMIVHRNLINGDVVLFNRQPSLHRPSIMAYYVKVLPGYNFRINDANTKPFNLDFDGDEMNMHVPQTTEAVVEARGIMSVTQNLRSPCTGRPLVSFIQDTATAFYRLSEMNMWFSREQAMQLVSQFVISEKPQYDTELDVLLQAIEMERPALCAPAVQRKDPKSGKWIPLWSGKQIISMLMPKNISVFHKEQHIQEHESVVLACGTLCVGRTTSKGPDVVPKVVCMMESIYGGIFTTRWMSRMTLTLHWFLQRSGITCSLQDLQNAVPQETESIHQKMIAYVDKHFEPFQIPSPEDEIKIQKGFAIARNLAEAEMIAHQPKRRNHFLDMALAGSKGSILNLSLINCALSQQFVNNSRILNHNIRFFSRSSGHAQAHGYVASSFLKGLLPQEYMFHAMGGIEGLVDTAVKTADVGELARQVMKMLEPLMLYPDGTVRDHTGRIVSIFYGDNCFDCSKLKIVQLPCFNMTLEDMQRWYVIDWKSAVNPNWLTESASHRWTEQLSQSQCIRLLKRQTQRLFHSRNALRTNKSRLYGQEWSDRFVSPIVWKDLVESLPFQRNPSLPSGKTDITPYEVAYLVEHLWERLRNEGVLRIPIFGFGLEGSSTAEPYAYGLKALFFDFLHPSRLWLYMHVDRQALLHLLQLVYLEITGSVCNSGEMVGTLAAQSISEPSTQMTLNTFHQAGQGSAISVGFPRLKEIANAIKEPSQPTMTVVMHSRFNNQPLTFVQQCTRGWHEKKLGSFVSSSSLEHFSICSDPLLMQRFLRWDVDQIGPTLENRELWSAYTLRFVLNKSVCAEYSTNPEQIVSILRQDPNLDEGHLWVYSRVSDPEWVIRLTVHKHSKRLYEKGFVGSVHIEERDHLKTVQLYMLRQVRANGIAGITSTSVFPCTDTELDPQTCERRVRGGWKVNVFGIDLDTFLCHPDVDGTCTVSNHLYEMERCFGINATALWLEQQLHNVFVSNSLGCMESHTKLLVQQMTFGGRIATRKRIAEEQMHVLERVSIDKPTQNFTAAAQHAESDPLKATPSCIMMGKCAPIGTCASDIRATEPDWNWTVGDVWKMACDRTFELDRLYSNDDEGIPKSVLSTLDQLTASLPLQGEHQYLSSMVPDSRFQYESLYMFRGQNVKRPHDSLLENPIRKRVREEMQSVGMLSSQMVDEDEWFRF